MEGGDHALLDFCSIQKRNLKRNEKGGTKDEYIA